MERKTDPAKLLKQLLAFALFCILILSGWFFWGKLEGENPAVLTQIPSSLNLAREFAINISDPKSGIRKIKVSIEQNGKETVLKDYLYPLSGSTDNAPVYSTYVSLKTDVKKLGISDGKAILKVMVRDNSWRGWFHGNKTSIEKEILIDSRPPEISVLTKVHHLNQGGAGLVIYRLSEPAVNGVMVGDIFYPGQAGYFSNQNIYLAFIAIGYKQGPKTEIFIKAKDEAENEARAGFHYSIKPKTFIKDTITLSDSFLNQKMPEFEEDIPANSPNPMLAIFLKVNKELREANYQKISSAVQESDSRKYWEGLFTRLPNSAPRAGFADHRIYLYAGKEVDQQDHLGVDLASLKHSPVPAANNGKVVLVDFIGIYGKTVIIDHGFGLFSMYSHLNSYNVTEGQMVSKNAIIGYTGITGLAAGDHLHYSMLVRQTFINPVEWWDESWIKNNITAKIEEVKSLLK